MKKDRFLQHAVTARSNVRIMMLMDVCGMKGCGIYWMVIEYFRVKVEYGSPMILLKTFLKQLRVYYQKMLHIVEDFGLFKVRKGPSLPSELVQSMRQLDEKPERFTLNTRKEDIAKTLKISTTSLSRASAVQYRVVQSSTVQDSIDKSSVVVEDLSATTGTETHCNEKLWNVSPDRETYIGRLFAERFWMETTAMHFKSRVSSRGKDAAIVSLEDAKDCLYNFMASTSPACCRLVAYLDSRRWMPTATNSAARRGNAVIAAG